MEWVCRGTGCSEDPDVKGTETYNLLIASPNFNSCSEDPDVKGTETYNILNASPNFNSCSEDPDVKGTETAFNNPFAFIVVQLQRGSRCKGN